MVRSPGEAIESSPGQGDITEQAEKPEIQCGLCKQVPENDAHGADQLAGLVFRAPSFLHNLLVLQDVDDILIR